MVTILEGMDVESCHHCGDFEGCGTRISKKDNSLEIFKFFPPRCINGEAEAQGGVAREWAHSLVTNGIFQHLCQIVSPTLCPAHPVFPHKPRVRNHWLHVWSCCTYPRGKIQLSEEALLQRWPCYPSRRLCAPITTKQQWQQSFPFCVVNSACIISFKPLQQPKELVSLLQIRKQNPRERWVTCPRSPSYKERLLNWNSDLWTPELTAVCFPSNLPLHFKALL